MLLIQLLCLLIIILAASITVVERWEENIPVNKQWPNKKVNTDFIHRRMFWQGKHYSLMCVPLSENLWK